MRDALEKNQLWVCLGALACGLMLAAVAPRFSASLDRAVPFLLAALLFTAFVQTPWRTLPQVLADRRFVTAVVLGNFVAIPVVLAAFLSLVPLDPAVELGLALVLVVPCTDWFIVFAGLGGGSTPRAVAISPVNLVLQILLLPGWLALFDGPAGLLGSWDTAVGAVAVVLVPLAAAGVLEVLSRGGAVRRERVEAAGAGAVPLLGAVLFCVAAAHGPAAEEGLLRWGPALPVFLAFAVLAVLLALALARALRLDGSRGWTLAFSMASRNSFLVLPLALAAADPVVAEVVVAQAVLELVLLSVLVRVAPALPFGAR